MVEVVGNRSEEGVDTEVKGPKQAETWEGSNLSEVSGQELVEGFVNPLVSDKENRA